MKNIRILHVLGGLNQGGVENLLMNIYRNIDRSKIQFDFLVNREGFFDSEVKELGGKIYYISSLQTIGERNYKKELNDFFVSHKREYKIVHSHLNQVSGVILEIAYKNNIPVRISHSHNNAYSINIIAKLYKELLRKKIDKYANVKLACSESAAKFMFRQKYKDAIIINNGIPVEKFYYDVEKRKKFRKEYSIKNDEIIIGHVGRFEKQKNHKFLIKIFKEILSKYKKARLIMLGTGSTKEYIIQQCEDIKENVLFIEPNPNTDLLYSGIDAFVFPSLYEGLGMALIEAQTCGLYCYASSDVIPEMVKISDKLKFVSLNDSEREWAKIILNDINLLKSRKSGEIVNNPFDIKGVVQCLSRLYLEKYRENK